MYGEVTIERFYDQVMHGRPQFINHLLALSSEGDKYVAPVAPGMSPLDQLAFMKAVDNKAD